MRKIKSHFFISLDGVVESPDKWHFPYFNDEMGAAVGAGFATTDAMLMGRVLYDEWAAFWPENADQPFGDVINPIKKYVVSSSLQSADWQNTEVIGGDAAQTLREIKAQDGGDISMSGSATTVRWLLREGLLDELNLLVHPIAVGDGLARLFPPDEPTIPLELLRSETFSTGVLNLSYGPAGTHQLALPLSALERRAAEPDLVAFGVAEDGLAHAVGVRLLLGGLEAAPGDLREPGVVVLEEQGVQRVAGVLGPLHDVDEAVLGEFPHGLRVVREERRRRPEQLLVPGQRRRVVLDGDAREEVEGHPAMLRRARTGRGRFWRGPGRIRRGRPAWRAAACASRRRP